MSQIPSTSESNLIEIEESINNVASDHGWQKVSYPKRNRKASSDHLRTDGVVSGGDNLDVFRPVEKHSDERRRRILEAQTAAGGGNVIRSKQQRSDEDEDEDESEVEGSGIVESEKKLKPKKVKKPKVTVADVAAKIDASDLEAFLVDVSVSYESQQDIQLMRFADYFGRAFSPVSASQFPWTKMFRESTIAKIADVPVSNISEAVYKTSVDWVNQQSPEALASFVLWSLDSILADLSSQKTGIKGSRKGLQQPSSRSQVAIFVVVAVVLRRKPDVLISVLPTLRENSKYQGQDKLPLTAWVIAQACHGDLAVGLYSWANNMLPLISGKNCNPQSRDLTLQLVERILSTPKARTILVNGAVRKGERLIPPSALEMLLRATFPASSARVKATERFEAVYPILKEVALAGTPRSKAMKQVSHQIMTVAVKAVGDGIPELSKEASGIFIWCLIENPDCYKQWDKIYLENLEASVAIMRKLSEDWKRISVQQSSLDALRETIKSFRHKNEGGLDGDKRSVFMESEKYCKLISGKLSRGHGCMGSMTLVIIVLAVSAALVSPKMETWDLNKLFMLTSQQSF